MPGGCDGKENRREVSNEVVEQFLTSLCELRREVEVRCRSLIYRHCVLRHAETWCEVLGFVVLKVRVSCQRVEEGLLYLRDELDHMQRP